MLDFYFTPPKGRRKLFVNFICYFVKFALLLQQQTGQVATSGGLPKL